jgi:hypothetical protein
VLYAALLLTLALPDLAVRNGVLAVVLVLTAPA